MAEAANRELWVLTQNASHFVSAAPIRRFTRLSSGPSCPTVLNDVLLRGPSGVDGGPAPCVELDRAPRERIPPTVSLRLAASPRVLLVGRVFAARGRIVGLSLSSANPIVTVLFENKSVEQYVDDSIATTKAVFEKKEKTLDEREDRLKKLDDQ